MQTSLSVRLYLNHGLTIQNLLPAPLCGCVCVHESIDIELCIIYGENVLHTCVRA